MVLEDPALLAALDALEKEAQTNASAAWFWEHVEPRRQCAWNIMQALIVADAFRDYGRTPEHCETWTPLLGVTMAMLIEGFLPLPRRLLQ